MKCLVKRIGRDLYTLLVNAETNSIEDNFQMDFMVIRSKNSYELRQEFSTIGIFTQPKKIYAYGETHSITEIIRELLIANEIINRDAEIHFEGLCR